MAAARFRPKGNTVSHEQSAAHFLSYRKILITLFQVSLVVCTYYCSLLLRFDFALDSSVRRLFISTVWVVVIIKLPVFHYFGLLRGWWRYAGMSDLMDIGKASFVSASLFYLTARFGLGLTGYPRSVFIIDMILTILLVGGARFAVRAYTENVHQYAARKNMIIVGAGAAGTAIVQELKRNPHLDYDPIGYVDDDTSKLGIKIHGRQVLGTTDDLDRLIAEYQVESLLIAIPSAKGKQVERIIRKCQNSRVEFKILPGLDQRINGSSTANINEMRKVRVEDLLGRDPVRLNSESITREIAGKTLLITGAGGSIGSELARQSAKFKPTRLVLFERSENDLFRLSNELSSSFPEQQFLPVVGDILDVNALKDCFALHRPDSVFHAAAYKHVPMMEMNCFQAVTNNIFGTYNVALVAKQYRAKNFVMISSDKAVNPTNIMGVTKRVAELTILGLQNHETRFSAVRFGNVLGSNGSVLPIFEQQLRNRGPITITHPKMTRYFMTMPESAQLVLQASTMGKGGDIFVLDMGEPIKILDLARNLIRISGCDPDNKVEIVFTGVRPGEKLFEELQFAAEGLKPTSHQKIRVLDGGTVDFKDVREWLDQLSALVETRNVNGLVTKLRTIVPEYLPSPEITALCDVDRCDISSKYRSARVALTDYAA